jgi:spermidine synthase
LNDGGIATYWLPIYQLNIEETKSILRAFHNAFLNTLVWSGPDEEWIMMGIKGAPRKIDNEQLERLWRDSNMKSDLARIGIETPEQLAAMYVMDGDEIDRISNETKPLTDLYPKRLSDNTAEDKSIHSFAFEYIRATAAADRFERSRLIEAIFPATRGEVLNPFFVIREMRYRARFEDRNWLADLIVHLRGSNLREPVLETLGTNSFRVAMAKKIEHEVEQLPIPVLPDLLADALARRNYSEAVFRLEDNRKFGLATANDLLLLTYLYCHSGELEKAESIASTIPDRDDPLTKWLLGKLQAEYGFRPPD